MRFYRKGSFLFTLLIFMFFLLLFFLSFNYDEQTRLTPLVVLIPGLIMTLFVLIGEFFPKLLSRMEVNLISLKQEGEKTEAPLSIATKLVGRKGLLIVTGWLTAFCILVFLFGFFIAIPITLFLFLTLFGGQSWLKSLAITAACWAFIYVVFNFLFEYELFRGIVFGEIVII